MDVKLVEQARNKDEEAYVKLIDLTSKKLYYTACTYVNDKDEAKNIVQDVYRNCFEKMYQLKDDSKFESWITVSVANKCRDYLRKNHKYDEVVVSDLNEEELDFEGNIEDERMEFKPDANFNYQELKEGLQGVLDELPEVQKMSIILVHLDGLKVKEAAVALNVPEGTVKSSISIGKQKIKNKIEELRKQNKSFYAVAPMPFLVWMLKEEMEKTSVPAFVVHASTIQPPKIPKKEVAAKKAVTTTATKTAATTATKAGAGKVIAGVVAAAVVGTGAVFGGYTVTKKVADHSTNQSSSKTTEIANIENMNYKILDTKVPDFESTPIDIGNGDNVGYLVKENDSYGFVGTNGKFIMEPKYKSGIIFELQEGNYACMALNKGDSEGYGTGNPYTQDNTCYLDGLGTPPYGYNLAFDEEHKPYVIDYESGEETKTYDWKKYFNTSSLISDNETGEYYIALYGEDRLIGPYQKNEQATFVDVLDDNNDLNVYGYDSRFIEGLIYEKVDGGYIIWNAKGTKHTDIVFDKVTVISNKAMKVEKDGQMGIVDKDLNLVYMGDFEDVSLPIDGKAYVKIKGEWKQIELVK